MSNFVQITTAANVVKLEFGAAIDTDNTKTTIKIEDIKMVSKSKEGVVIATLSDGRTWELTTLAEHINGTFPIEYWNGAQITSNNELFNNIENLIL
jgi:hypothetical protein